MLTGLNKLKKGITNKENCRYFTASICKMQQELGKAVVKKVAKAPMKIILKNERLLSSTVGLYIVCWDFTLVENV